MRTVTEYIVMSGTRQEICRRVNKAIKIGYQPYGSLMTENNSFHQPMVKYADPQMPSIDELTEEAKPLLTKPGE